MRKLIDSSQFNAIKNRFWQSLKRVFVCSNLFFLVSTLALCCSDEIKINSRQTKNAGALKLLKRKLQCNKMKDEM